jgi:hypothetical protein
MSDTIDSLAKAAQDAYSARSRLAGIRAIVGFDGFVDILARVVKDRDLEGRERYYASTREFGEAIAAAGGSRSLELVRTALKAGGNMPIVASSLGSYGIGVSCIGALGYPIRHPAFDSLPATCESLCFADPAQTTALEFDDGKIMLAEMSGLHEATWEVVKERVGLERLRSIAAGVALVGFCNWSEIDASDGIWRGMLGEVLEDSPPEGGRFLLFDLSDCSKRPAESIRAAARLVAGAASRGEIVLSLNANEARLVAGAIGASASDPGSAAAGIRSFIGAGSVVVHYRDGAVSADGRELRSSPALPVLLPLRATGSGDNFNAGYCVGALLGFGEGERLDLGNVFAGYYRATGESPEPRVLAEFFTSRSSEAVAIDRKEMR